MELNGTVYQLMNLYSKSKTVNTCCILIRRANSYRKKNMYKGLTI